jgi:signal transduction histidine kinase
LKAKLQELERGKTVTGWEVQLRPIAGEALPVCINITPIYAVAGDADGLRWAIRDISRQQRAAEELRKSEERYRALVTASSEVLYRVSPDWSEIRQLTSRGSLANTEQSNPTWLLDYIPLEDQPHVTAAINEAIRTESVFELEHRVRQADGSIGWTYSRAIPMLDANGEIVEWFGAASDITERKRAEEALQRYAENLGRLHHDLEVSNREANLYLDILTHDIGNTENVSNLYADLLIESLDGESAGYAKKLQRSIQKSIEILGTVSTIRQIHRSAPEIRPTDLDAAVRRVIENYPTSIFLYNGAHHQVQADDLLFVVFNNLIGNAVKFGGPGVEIAVRTEEQNGGVLVTVEDTGPGIPDDEKDEIFHRYEQHKRGVGEGLGLYLVQILVERYGGRVWVEDRVPGCPEEGAAFKFTLKKA